VGANDNGVPYIGFSVRSHKSLPAEVCAVFDVRNKTDYQTDYFDKDRFTVTPSHPMWKEALAAYIANQTHALARLAKREIPYSDFGALSRQLDAARAMAEGRPAPVQDDALSAYFRVRAPFMGVR
jgi:hypothetical protein